MVGSAEIENLLTNQPRVVYEIYRVAADKRLLDIFKVILI